MQRTWCFTRVAAAGEHAIYAFEILASASVHLPKQPMWVYCLSAAARQDPAKWTSVSMQCVKGVYPPSGCIPQLINIQLGGLRVCVMDVCRWGVWQLINALIISSEDLPLLPELTEWAVCGLTSNAVFRARPLLSTLPGSHSFSSQRKICTFCAEKVYNSDETVQLCVLGSLPLQWARKTTFHFSLLMFGSSSGPLSAYRCDPALKPHKWWEI